MGLRVITDDRPIKVWRNDQGQFPRYSVSISKKVDDKYENLYIDLHFPRGTELQNGEEITIKDSFPSFNIGNDGKKYQYIQVREFTRVNGNADEGTEWMNVSGEEIEMIFE